MKGTPHFYIYFLFQLFDLTLIQLTFTKTYNLQKNILLQIIMQLLWIRLHFSGRYSKVMWTIFKRGSSKMYCLTFLYFLKFYLLSDSRATSIVYTRWGKKTCPFGAELILSGGYKLRMLSLQKFKYFDSFIYA